jgi:hypothetical protein
VEGARPWAGRRGAQLAKDNRCGPHGAMAALAQGGSTLAAPWASADPAGLVAEAGGISACPGEANEEEKENQTNAPPLKRGE